MTDGHAGGLQVDRGEIDAAKLLCGARLQSRCAGGLRGTWMEGTGGKSGRRPGRHLQVEAFGLEMLLLRTGGLQVDSGTAKLLRARVRGSAPAEGIQTFRRDLEARSGRLLEPRSQPDTASRSFCPQGRQTCAQDRLASRFGCGTAAEGRVCGAQARASRFGLPSGHSCRRK